jgi:adenylate kinase family enzyme
MRVHILGASGSGTTTLGAALADRVDADHLDTDDYFWLPTDPPFETSRPAAERLERLEADLDAAGRWVLSGSLCGWGDPLIPRFELVVFLLVPTGVRLARLTRRETAEFGAEAIEPEGRMYENFKTFIEWAASYDDGDLDMRSLARHDDWLAALPCPVLLLEGEMSTAEQVEGVLAALGETSERTGPV